MKRFTIATCAALGLASAAAQADTMATITSVAGEPGSVVVLRDGQSINATPDFQLLENDRLIVRSDGVLDVTAESCSVSLKAPAMAIMNNSFCAGSPLRLETADAGASTGGSGSSGLSLPSVGGTAAAGGAGAGALAVAAAAASGSSGSGSAITGSGDAATGSDGEVVGSGSGGGSAGPTADFFDTDDFNPGSGLDDGLFGFFEATSS